MSIFQMLMNFILSFLNKKAVINKEEPKEETPTSYYDYVKQLYLDSGAQWDTVNIFGIRNAKEMGKGVLNDYIGIATKEYIWLFEGTTDPGVYYTKNRLNDKGVAHICLGYHKNVYKVDKHKGLYEAMRQTGAPITIWRDGNNNFVKDESDVIQKGYFGVNIHKASDYKNVVEIGKWSAGCQVIRKKRDFNKFMKIIKESDKYIKNKNAKFSYFLFNNNQIEIDFNYLVK